MPKPISKGHRRFQLGAIAVLTATVLVEAFVLVGGVGFIKQHAGLASVLPGVVSLLTNEARTDEQLAALTDSPVLAKGAQMKADDMAQKGYFSHTGPDGSQPWKWFAAAGYTYQYAGENLAVNFSESEDVVNAWLNSPTHRANILKQNFTETGIGIATGTYKGKETVFVVQFFGKPAPAALAQRGGADGGAVSPDEFLFSGQVLGTSTSMLEQFLSSPESPQKQVFYVLLGVFVFLLAVGFVFGKRFPKLWPTICILLALAVLLGFAVMNKTELFGETTLSGEVGA